MPAWTSCGRTMGAVLVIEVNGIPGWRGLQQTTDVDVAGVIAEHAIATRGGAMPVVVAR